MKLGKIIVSGHRGRLIKEAAVKDKDHQAAPDVSSDPPSAEPFLPRRRTLSPDASGNLVPRSGHRGALLKGLLIKPKDSLYAGARPSVIPLPKPQRDLPGISFGRVNHVNRYSTPRELRDAMRACPQVEDLRQLQAEVEVFLRAEQARSDPSKPTIVLLGEQHDSTLSHLVKRVVVAKFRGQPECKVLMKQRAEAIEQFEERHAQMDEAYQAFLMGRPHEVNLGEHGAQYFHHFVRKNGLQAAGFDPMKFSATSARRARGRHGVLHPGEPARGGLQPAGLDRTGPPEEIPR
jgi:hypothetical protein